MYPLLLLNPVSDSAIIVAKIICLFLLSLFVVSIIFNILYSKLMTNLLSSRPLGKSWSDDVQIFFICILFIFLVSKNWLDLDLHFMVLVAAVTLGWIVTSYARRRQQKNKVIANIKLYRECVLSEIPSGSWERIHDAHKICCNLFGGIPSHIAVADFASLNEDHNIADYYYRLAIHEGADYEDLRDSYITTPVEQLLLRGFCFIERASPEVRVQDDDETLDIDTIDIEPAVARLSTKILKDAISHEASHLYFEPTGESFDVWYRRNGVYFLRDKIPEKVRQELTLRFKYMSTINLSQTNRDQQGFMHPTVAGLTYNIFIGTMHGEHGESIVLNLEPTNTNFECHLKGKELKAEGKRLDIPGAARMKAEQLRTVIAFHG